MFGYKTLNISNPKLSFLLSRDYNTKSMPLTYNINFTYTSARTNKSVERFCAEVDTFEIR